MIKSEQMSKNIPYSHLICLDENVNGENNNDQIHRIIQDLKTLVSSSAIFCDIDQCFDYITDLPDDEEKAIVIYSGALISNIIPFLEDISQIDSIYILQENLFNDAQQQRYRTLKMKSEHKDIKSISKSIRQTMRRYSEDSLTLPCIQSSIKTIDSHRNELEASLCLHFSARKYSWINIFKRSISTS